jgi:pimeloyl-ACP methyl ester carboxylesterase
VKRRLAGGLGLLRAQAPVPVSLVGTSMGSVSAASVAERLRDGDGPGGIVLTSSVTRYSSRKQIESLRDVALERIPVDVLVVRHRADGCASSPYDAAPGVLARLRQAPRRELHHGGRGRHAGRPLRAVLAPRLPGREEEVVERIAAWIEAGAR